MPRTDALRGETTCSFAPRAFVGFTLVEVMVALAIVAVLGPGLMNALIAVAAVNVPFFARTIRGITVGLAGREFIDAARLAGMGHALPKPLTMLVLLAVLLLGHAWSYYLAFANSTYAFRDVWHSLVYLLRACQVGRSPYSPSRIASAARSLQPVARAARGP